MSSIEWTDKTWNPTKGCSKVSPGCANCYAIRMAARLQVMGHISYAGITKKSGKKTQWTGKISFDEKAYKLPLSWKSPRRIFVNSMSDLFHEKVSEKRLQEIWTVMKEADWHQYQVLTKRPERMLKILSNTDSFPILPHVWLGVSVESNEYVNRLDILRQVPANIRFVSLEPLLGSMPDLSLDNIDWAIVGGESGPGSRALDESWVEDIEVKCRHSGTAFFFKQWGGVNKKKAGRLFKNRTWDEYPDRGQPMAGFYANA